MDFQAKNTVNGPAIALMITAGLGGAWCLLWGVIQILALVGALADGNGEQAFGHAFWIVQTVLGLAGAAFIWWAVSKMRELEKHQMCIFASIVAMIPCISPCCIAGLPIGIWSLMTLNKPEVKDAFTS